MLFTSDSMLFPVSYSQRPASIQWEPLPVARFTGIMLWAWYRPGNLPSGVVVAIPAELMKLFPGGIPITLADILAATGVPWHQFQAVSLYGGDWQPAVLIAPFVNHPIPPVPPGGRAEISVAILEQQAMVPMFFGMPMSPVPMTNTVQNDSGPVIHHSPQPGVLAVDMDLEFTDDSEYEDDGAPLSESLMFERIEAAWRTAIQIERQMTGLRQKLASMLAGLGKLDRELTPDERVASDREDRDEWNDARRWLRDLQSKCHKEIKAFDIGMTSGAGSRRHLEEIFQSVIEPRISSGRLEVHRGEFEKHRKDMVSLQRSMVTALQAASQNGTQRAQRILGKIAGKIREMRVRNREPIGGTNLDKSCRRKR